MFFNCSSLESLPDISKWNTTNVEDMSFMFYQCNLLKTLPNINKFETKKVNNMRYMFYGCYSLNSLSNIDDWDISSVTNMNSMFNNCCSLKSIPDISKWNTKNVADMNYMFFNCLSLESLNISKWDVRNVTDMDHMFSNCISFKSLPDISKWNINNNNENIFHIDDNLKNINLTNFDYEQTINSQVSNNIANLEYRLDENKNMLQLFSPEFVKKNKYYCELLIDGKKSKLWFEINEY